MLKKTQRSLLQPALEHILCKDLFGKENYLSEISQICEGAKIMFIR